MAGEVSSPVIWIARLTAWIGLSVILFVTLVPPSLRPTSVAPHLIEHLVAFVILGAAFEWAYPRDWRVPAVAFPFIAALELLQLFMPGRHARLGDFLVNAIGAYVGIAVVALARRRKGKADAC
jgi:VanZ family protein